MIVGYLSVEQVRALHADQLRLYGGATGLRDRGALESALARPAMTFDGEDLYEGLASKVAAMTLAVAEGKVAVEALAIWFRQRLRATE